MRPRARGIALMRSAVDDFSTWLASSANLARGNETSGSTEEHATNLGILQCLFACQNEDFGIGEEHFLGEEDEDTANGDVLGGIETYLAKRGCEAFSISTNSTDSFTLSPLLAEEIHFNGGRSTRIMMSHFFTSTSSSTSSSQNNTTNKRATFISAPVVGDTTSVTLPFLFCGWRGAWEDFEKHICLAVPTGTFSSAPGIMLAQH
eukprot:GSA25T00006975001.1